jgi:hypothetical protein
LNAIRHGILTKRIALETDEDRAQFQALVQSCDAEFAPEGLLEKFLVEEIATALWKLHIAVGLETRELSSRQGLRDRLSGFFDGEIKLPIEAEDLPLDRGWDCERLVIRVIAGQDAGNSGTSRGPRVVEGQVVRDFQDSGKRNNRSASHIELEAELGNSLARITRYQSSLKKDLYRAIETLRVVQKEKRDLEG